MLNTNLLSPTESTELNVFFISAKLFQSASSVFLHHSFNAFEAAGNRSAKSYKGFREIMRMIYDYSL
jgi:hypothetical protein